MSHEDVQEIVLPIWIGLSSKSKDLASLAVSIHNVQIAVRPKAETA
jgi:hypothetical protein